MFSFFSSKPELPSELSIVDNLAIFEKEKKNDLELKIYNPEYFHSIGIDKVSIDLVPVETPSVSKKQKGGYYFKKDYKKLTIPFRYFVYMVQGEGKEEGEIQDIPKKPFGKLPSIFSNIKNWFSRPKTTDVPVKETKVETPVEETKVETPVEETKVETPVEETKVETPVEETKVETPVEETKVETPVEETKVETPVEETKVETPVEDTKVETPVEETKVETPVEDAKVEDKIPETPLSGNMKWVLKFEIDPDAKPICTSKNKHEKEECEFIEKMKQVKKQRDMGVIINGKIYYINGRPIMLGEVEENTKIKITETGLPNTLVDKYARRGWM